MIKKLWPLVTPFSFLPFLSFALGILYTVSNKLDLLTPAVLYTTLYFLIVVPLLVYTFSTFGTKEFTKQSFIVLALALLLSLPPLALLSTPALVLYYLFLFCLYFFYMNPLIFLKRGILAPLAFIVFLIPGFLGYAQIALLFPPKERVIEALLWSIGVYLLYTLSDNKKIFWLKKEYILLIIVAVWSFASYTLVKTNYYFATVLVFPFIPLAVLTQKSFTVSLTRKYFPLVTGVLGICTLLFLSAKLFF